MYSRSAYSANGPLREKANESVARSSGGAARVRGAPNSSRMKSRYRRRCSGPSVSSTTRIAEYVSRPTSSSPAPSTSAGDNLHAPPPARDPVCDDRKHEIQVLRTVAWIQEGESFAVFNGRGFRLYTHATGRILDQPEIAVRVRTKLPGVVIERGAYAGHHAAQIRGMPAGDGRSESRRSLSPSSVPLFFVHRVAGGEHSVLIVDGYIRDVMEVASPAFRPRAAERPRRHGDLILARPHDRLEGDRVAADSDPARLGVVERWNGGPWGESILPSHSRTHRARDSADSRWQATNPDS